jgi:hypothetical protein
MLQERGLDTLRREQIPLLPVSIFASGLFALFSYALFDSPHTFKAASPSKSSAAQARSEIVFVSDLRSEIVLKQLDEATASRGYRED